MKPRQRVEATLRMIDGRERTWDIRTCTLKPAVAEIGELLSPAQAAVVLYQPVPTLLGPP